MPAPAALGIGLGAALLLGLTLVTALSVRDRRRDLAIMRALGSGNRLLRATVAWQSLATLAVGLAIGVPLGVIVGRVAVAGVRRPVGPADLGRRPGHARRGHRRRNAVLTVVAAAIPARAAARTGSGALHAE